MLNIFDLRVVPVQKLCQSPKTGIFGMFPDKITEMCQSDSDFTIKDYFINQHYN